MSVRKAITPPLFMTVTARARVSDVSLASKRKAKTNREQQEDNCFLSKVIISIFNNPEGLQESSRWSQRSVDDRIVRYKQAPGGCQNKNNSCIPTGCRFLCRYPVVSAWLRPPATFCQSVGLKSNLNDRITQFSQERNNRIYFTKTSFRVSPHNRGHRLRKVSPRVVAGGP